MVTPFTPKPEQRTNTRSETTRDGRQVVYETDEERKERLRLERLGDIIEERLQKVLDERVGAKDKTPEKKGDFFEELFS
jgi:hypothetical protein